MIFAENLKKVRIERRMSRPDLAQAAGVSAPAIYAWETTGRMPKRANIERLAGALGVTYGALTGDGGSDLGVFDNEREQSASQIIDKFRRDLASALSVAPNQISVAFEIRV